MTLSNDIGARVLSGLLLSVGTGLLLLTGEFVEFKTTYVMQVFYYVGFVMIVVGIVIAVYVFMRWLKMHVSITTF